MTEEEKFYWFGFLAIKGRLYEKYPMLTRCIKLPILEQPAFLPEAPSFERVTVKLPSKYHSHLVKLQNSLTQVLKWELSLPEHNQRK